MIDNAAYKRLHPPKKEEVTTLPYLGDENQEAQALIGPGSLDPDDPPDSILTYMFPPLIKGYHIRTKKWIDLEVDHVLEVAWRNDAFKSLVIEEDTKEPVLALVTNQLDAEWSTDSISGKGNGFVLLLHGGPGTGKPFTAKSVAEVARKPLLRVTCGDMGTKPMEVERYLESALHLGKIWGCVVLLDEADVFMESRSQMDLERNALVSVVLRVLEYYDGILILTSNRVGTFDEAFKSRIQLALHYENLTYGQRKQIWRNFLTRIQGFDPDQIALDDILFNLDSLADYDMNGRQIRNAITTARYLAKYNEKPLRYPDLHKVIKIASKFEEYLQDVHGAKSDALARDDGAR